MRQKKPFSSPFRRSPGSVFPWSPPGPDAGETSHSGSLGIAKHLVDLYFFGDGHVPSVLRPCRGARVEGEEEKEGEGEQQQRLGGRRHRVRRLRTGR